MRIPKGKYVHYKNVNSQLAEGMDEEIPLSATTYLTCFSITYESNL